MVHLGSGQHVWRHHRVWHTPAERWTQELVTIKHCHGCISITGSVASKFTHTVYEITVRKVQMRRGCNTTLDLSANWGYLPTMSADVAGTSSRDTTNVDTVLITGTNTTLLTDNKGRRGFTKLWLCLNQHFEWTIVAELSCFDMNLIFSGGGWWMQLPTEQKDLMSNNTSLILKNSSLTGHLHWVLTVLSNHSFR